MFRILIRSAQFLSFLFLFRSTHLWEKAKGKDPDPDLYFWLMDQDPDPGGPKDPPQHWFWLYLSLFLWYLCFLLMLTLLVSVVAGHKKGWASAPAREEEVWPGAARRPPPHTTPQERSRHQWRGRQRSVFSESERIHFPLSIWIWIRNYNFVSGFKSE